jgi:hypothetical protein
VSVSIVLHSPPLDPLAPVIDTLALVRAQRGANPVHGLVANLLAPADACGRGWLPATDLVSGAAVADLVAWAERHWHAAPHVAAALAFKSYAYWLALPAVLGYASARRIPLVAPENVLIRPTVGDPFVQLGLVRPVVAALAGDPVTLLAPHPGPALPDDAALLAHLKETLLDRHLTPVLEHLHGLARVGERTLLGSVASGIAYALVRSADALPGPVAETANEILTALDLTDLVEVGADLHVQRRTCCLAFTLPQPKVCSGCCIR